MKQDRVPVMGLADSGRSFNDRIEQSSAVCSVFKSKKKKRKKKISKSPQNFGDDVAVVPFSGRFPSRAACSDPPSLGAGLRFRSARVSDPAETADRRSPPPLIRPGGHLLPEYREKDLRRGFVFGGGG
jgi:hypothetical protein